MRLVFAGTPEFAVPALEALHAAGHQIAAVYTQPDRPAGRGRALSASAVKRRALELGLPVEQPLSFKGAAEIQGFADWRPELLVVVAYGLLLPPQVLALPAHGGLNIHASLLPRWRGAAPIQRAMLAGDTETGVAIMQMEAGLDTGPVLLTRVCPIAPRCTGGELHDRLAVIGAESIVTAIAGWMAGELSPVAQSAEGVTYARKLSKQEALIDWTNTAISIDRQVRAFDPWPVAETRWNGEQLRLWSVEPDPAPAGDSVVAAAPGTVIEAAGGRLRVATGHGALRIDRLQLAGRRIATAADFLNAHALAGARFG